MSDTDTIYTVVPRTRDVNLTCGKFTIKPLSNMQFIKLLAEMKDMQGELKGKLGEGKDHEVIVEALAQAGDKLPALLARLMGIKDASAEILKQLEDMTLEDTSVAARAIAEVNNFSAIFKNFRAAMELKKEPEQK